MFNAALSAEQNYVLQKNITEAITLPKYATRLAAYKTNRGQAEVFNAIFQNEVVPALQGAFTEYTIAGELAHD
jgi:hypothetical protein